MDIKTPFKLNFIQRLSRILQGSSDVEEDSISLPESRMSDSDVELLEQKVLELNQRLNMKTTECDIAQKELQITQVAATKSQDKVEELTVTVRQSKKFVCLISFSAVISCRRDVV